jgi:aminopeptidase N
MSTTLDPYRLPTDVVPSSYRIRMEPDLATGAFEGVVEIDVEVLAATPTIVLNAVDLVFDAATLRGAGAT